MLHLSCIEMTKKTKDFVLYHNYDNENDMSPILTFYEQNVFSAFFCVRSLAIQLYENTKETYDRHPFNSLQD